MINPLTKFKISTLTHSEGTTDNAKCRNWGSMGVTGHPRSWQVRIWLPIWL